MDAWGLSAPYERRLMLPVWESFTDQQMLGHLHSTSVDAQRVEADLRLWVRELRRRGVTWSRIAEALGGTAEPPSASGVAYGWAEA